MRCTATYNNLLDADIAANNASASSASSAVAAAAATGQAPSSSPAKSGLSGGAIAGIVVGVVVFLALVVLGLWFCLRRRYKRRDIQTQQDPQQHQPVAYKPAEMDQDIQSYPHAPSQQFSPEAPTLSPAELSTSGTAVLSELDGFTEKNRSPVSLFTPEEAEGKRQ